MHAPSSSGCAQECVTHPVYCCRLLAVSGRVTMHYGPHALSRCQAEQTHSAVPMDTCYLAHPAKSSVPFCAVLSGAGQSGGACGSGWAALLQWLVPTKLLLEQQIADCLPGLSCACVLDVTRQCRFAAVDRPQRNGAAFGIKYGTNLFADSLYLSPSLPFLHPSLPVFQQLQHCKS